MKVAILDALPRIYWSDDGGYTDGEKLRDLLSPCMDDATFDVFYVAEGEIPTDIAAYDAIVSSGSSASVHDEEPWIAALTALLKEADDQRKKILGICFSHQLIATLFGGEVIHNETGWLIGNYPLTIQKVLPWMQPGAATTSVHHFNQQRVSRLPESATAFARSEHYDNFAFTIGNHILCIQGHPEQATPSISNWLASMENDLPEDQLQRARQMTAAGLPDQALWANWFSCLLRG